jgi:predicted RNase H-like HicB family nuclease
MSERYVVYRLASDGNWTGSVRGLPRCRARGRTLRVARRRLREALLEALGDEGAGASFVEDVRLPGGARRLVLAHWKARRAMEARRRLADDAARAAAAALRAAGLSPRDVGDLLGLSPAKLAAALRRAR